MKLNLIFFTFLVAVLISSPAIAQTGVQTADEVVLTDGQDQYPLGRHLEILRDPSGELTIQDVTSTGYQNQFTHSQVDSPNFGFQEAAYWVRFRVSNQAEQNSAWVLAVDYTNMHYVDLYVPSTNGRGYVVKQSGVMRPYQNRDIPFHVVSFNLNILPGTEQTIYLRFQSDASMTLGLTFSSSKAFTNFMLRDQLIYGIFSGAIIIMGLYNLLLWLFVRDRSYLYLVLFIFSQQLALFVNEGIIYQYIQFNNPRVPASLQLIFFGLEIFFILKFVGEALDLRNNSPKLYRGSGYYGWLFILTILLGPFGPYRIIALSQLSLGLVLFAAIAVVTAWFVWTGSRPARFLFISWIWFIITGIFFALTRMGIMSSTPFTEHAARIAIVWMVAFWSLALADRVNVLKVEAEATSRQLRDSESRLSQFMEAMPVGVVVYSTDLKPRFLNREAQRLLTESSKGVFPDVSFQRSMSETAEFFSFRVTGTERPYPLEQLPAIRAMRDGKPAKSDDVEISVGGQRIPTESWASPLFDESGEITGTVVAFQDIHERLQKEALLREREGQYQITFEQAAVGIAHVSPKGNFIRINQKFSEITGYSQDEITTLTFQDITHPDDLEPDFEYTERILSGEIESFTLEKRYIQKGGLVVWVSLSVSLLRKKSGEPNYFISVVEDITSRKAAEEQILFQARILEAVEQAVIVTDKQGRIVYWNPYAERMYGWSAEEAIGKTTLELISSEQALKSGAEIMESLQTGESWSGEYLARRKDGSLMPIDVTNTPISDGQGALHLIIGISSDISRRKQAEEALRQSQELQHLALEGARLGIWSADPVSGDILWDKRTQEIFTLAHDEPVTLEMLFNLIHPDDRVRAQEAFVRAIDPHSDGIYADEMRIIQPDGQVCWIFTRGNAVFKGQGAERRAVRLVGIIMDITQRKLAEHALEKSEARFSKLIETMNEGLGVSDEQDRFTYVNPRLAEMLGYTQEEMLGRSVADFFDPENRKIIADKLAQRRVGEEQQPYTITWCRKDGYDLHTLVSPAVIFNQNNIYLHTITVVTDISEQVRASQLLDQRVTERTHELSTLLEVSQLVVSTLELEPLLQVILDQLKSVVEYNGAVIYAMSDRLLFTRDFPLRVGKEKAMLMAQTLMHELSKDERILRNEVIFIPDLLADTEDGDYLRHNVADFLDINSNEMRSWMGIPLTVKNHLIGIMSVYHNVVDYYTPKDARLAFAFANQAVVAIENARLFRQAQVIAASEERSRLARELHDSVTQALYSLTLFAQATRAAMNAGKLEVAKKNLDEVVAVAREGMGDLRLLIFELRPPVLEKEGLVGALQARLEAVEARSGIRTKFHAEGEPKLSSEIEKELYWSVHEALNNVLKHARAKNVSLEMLFQNGFAEITLRDDGTGFDPSTLYQAKGIGLKNIADRVEKLGGSLEVTSTPGQGTVFRIQVKS